MERHRLVKIFQKIWGIRPAGWRSLLAGMLIVAFLLFLPTGYEDAVIYQGADKVKAKVIDADNSAVRETGLIRTGEQICTVVIQGGSHKGETASAVNLLTGSLSQDKEFRPGDTALVVVSCTDAAVTSVTMVDHYRIDWEVLLLIVFTVLLFLFAGPAGIRALLSFFITVLCLWKILIPVCLNGGDPIICGLIIVAVLTMIIIVFVYGMEKRSLVAITGSMLGVITACILGSFFTSALKIHGAIMTDSESLLYSGYQDLNLTRIFMASIFVGASGAMMDLAVDITSGISEVVRKKPDIGRWEAVGSGIRIGQAAMGTMTTTLLLAYAGSCTAQLMVFMAQGTPVINILNYKYVSAEILQTLAGSFALVTVAPFTAIVGGLLLTRKGKKTR